MLGIKNKPKVKYVDTDPLKTIPKAMLPNHNRRSRRFHAKQQRTATQQSRVYKAQQEHEKRSVVRREALEKRLETVRARTKARKGRFNNPRFREKKHE